MAVRARRIFGPMVVVPASTFFLVYTVPAGRTLVIKSLIATSFGTSVSMFWAADRSDGSGQGLLYGTTVGAGTGVAAGFDWTLNPLEKLYAWCNTAATLWVYGSGSLLAGAPL